MTTLDPAKRDEWIGLRADYLQQHGPDEFPRAYYEYVAAHEWGEKVIDRNKEIRAEISRAVQYIERAGKDMAPVHLYVEDRFKEFRNQGARTSYIKSHDAMNAMARSLAILTALLEDMED